MSQDAQGVVRLELVGAVAFLTLDRPLARNALTWTMYDQLAAALDRVAGDEGVRLAVLRGAGGTFASGTDIGQLAEIASGEEGLAYERRIEAVVRKLESLPVPTLAVVEGAAAGAGLLLALACDLRVCSGSARFGAPIARTVGNCLSVASLARVLAHLGPARTREILFLGGFLGAEEAKRAGVVVEVVPAEALEERVRELCERLLAMAPLTLSLGKEALARLAAEALPPGDDLVLRAYQSRDFREGVTAFLEKRPPRWQGS